MSGTYEDEYEEYVREHYQEFTDAVNKEFDHSKGKLRKDLIAWIKNILLNTPVHYEWQPGSEPWDDSGELVEEGFIPLDQTVLEFLNEYTGQWKPASQSRHSKRYSTYEDDLEEDYSGTVDLLVMGTVYKKLEDELHCGLMEDDMEDLHDELFDDLYSDTIASSFFNGSFAVQFAGIGSRKLNEIMDPEEYRKAVQKKEEKAKKQMEDYQSMLEANGNLPVLDSFLESLQNRNDAESVIRAISILNAQSLITNVDEEGLVLFYNYWLSHYQGRKDIQNMIQAEWPDGPRIFRILDSAKGNSLLLEKLPDYYSMKEDARKNIDEISGRLMLQKNYACLLCFFTDTNEGCNVSSLQFADKDPDFWKITIRILLANVVLTHGCVLIEALDRGMYYACLYCCEDETLDPFPQESAEEFVMRNKSFIHPLPHHYVDNVNALPASTNINTVA